MRHISQIPSHSMITINSYGNMKFMNLGINLRAVIGCLQVTTTKLEHALIRHQRCLLSSKVRKPSNTNTTSWERGAKLIKSTDGQSTESSTSKTNKYMEEIRSIHDPSLHIKTLEEELLGTMGQALGKQGEKINLALQVMDQERTKYHKILLDQSTTSDENLRDVVTRHNESRELAKKARWELLVHRQAVGFTVGNHKYVMDTFPIPDRLVLPDDYDETNECVESKSPQNKHRNKKQQISSEPVQRTFTDQLDWWQTIGRWK